MGWSEHHALQLLARVRVSLRPHSSFLVSRPRVRLVGRAPVRWLARAASLRCSSPVHPAGRERLGFCRVAVASFAARHSSL